MKLVIEAGANCNMANNDGCTPLWFAAAHGHLECLEFLIKVGADCHIAPDAGSTPAEVAAEMGHLECKKFLIEEGAKKWSLQCDLAAGRTSDGKSLAD
jgi:ankyrin repeat protein